MWVAFLLGTVVAVQPTCSVLTLQLHVCNFLSTSFPPIGVTKGVSLSGCCKAMMYVDFENDTTGNNFRKPKVVVLVQGVT